MNRRVAVTGLGVVSSIGIGRDTFWNSLIDGKSGISNISLFDTSKFSRHNGGEIKNFNPSEYIKNVKYLGRASQFAIAATKLALSDAGMPATAISEKNAVIIGTTLPEGGDVDLSSKGLLEGEGVKILEHIMLNLLPSSISRNVSYYFDLKGRNLLIPNACSAGNYAIGYGFDLIKKGEIETAIVGGSEALSRIIFQGFQRLYAVAPDFCSPFDKNRKGIIPGEGAGVLFLENMDNAIKRNAKIYAEVAGYGLSCDAHHMTIPKKDGILKAMKKALKNSGMVPGQIDYINAHGTGTNANDKEESSAIRELFPEKNIPVSSIKSMLGHTMGAASSIEAVACCLAIQNNMIPPTINFSTPDPDCNIDCVPNTSRKARLNCVLNNGFAFGGNNCCVVLSRIN